MSLKNKKLDGGFFYKGFWVDTSMSYSPEGLIVVMFPDIERYFSCLEDVKRAINDKRANKAMYRRIGRNNKKHNTLF